LQNILVGGELALSVILVVGATLLAQSFERLYEKGPGFRSAGLKSMYVNLPTFEYQGNFPNLTATLWQRLMTAARETPGVESVAAVSHLPLAGFYYLADLEVEGYQSTRDNRPQAIDRYVWWSPDGNLLYFISERDGFVCLWAQRLDPATKHPQGAAFPIRHFHTPGDRSQPSETRRSWGCLSELAG